MIDANAIPSAERTMLHFVVPAVPVAQPRPRATAINGKARMFEAKKAAPIHAFKASVRMAAAEAFAGAPIQGPILLAAVFVFPRPGRLRWKSRPMRRELHTGRPDIDNLVKGLADALNEIIWVDDAQIALLKVEKWIAAGDEQPHVEVTIEEM